MSTPALWTAAFWTVRAPDAWPPPPRRFSFSALREVEVCPRRHALRRATYGDAWRGRTYPDPLSPAAAEGRVVHGALEHLVEAVVEAGASGPADVVGILRGAGGYVAFVRAGIDREAASWRENPRAARAAQDLAAHFHRRAYDLAAHVQRLFALVVAQGLPPAGVAPLKTDGSSPPTGRAERAALDAGAHPEVWLQADDLGFHGIADLVVAGREGADLYDYKTGAPKLEHADQLGLYALLWAHDRARNPEGLPVRRLTVVYGSGAVDVPPPTDLGTLARATAARCDAARADLTESPPPARPTPDTCGWCPVRHLCTDYWLALQAAGGTWRPGPLSDAEFRPEARVGPRSWRGTVTASTVAAPGTPAVLLAADGPSPLAPGHPVRLLGVRHATADDGIELHETNRSERFAQFSEAIL